MPVFQSTSQALHFAYLIEAYEMSCESIMAKALRIHMMALGIWNDGPPSTVDFGGLNAQEVRGQCAMIRAAVRDRLPGPEAWVIQARYGINDVVVEADGRRRQIFSSERKAAVIRLAEYFAPSFRHFSRFALRVLVARAVGARVTFREMSQEFGGEHTAYFYAAKRMIKSIGTLETIAINRLEPAFVADGLVDPGIPLARDWARGVSK